MATPAKRFRLAPISRDAISIPVDAAEDHPGQWVLRRVGSNGYVSVDNQAFSVGDAFKGELVDVFVDGTVVQVLEQEPSDQDRREDADRTRRKVRADGLVVKDQPKLRRQASAGT